MLSLRMLKPLMRFICTVHVYLICVHTQDTVHLLAFKIQQPSTQPLLLRF